MCFQVWGLAGRIVIAKLQERHSWTKVCVLLTCGDNNANAMLDQEDKDKRTLRKPSIHIRWRRVPTDRHVPTGKHNREEALG